MHLVDGEGTVTPMPTPAAVGDPGWFADEATEPATQVTGDWLNAVQAELKNAIEGQELTLDKTIVNQLFQAIVAGLVSSGVSVFGASSLHKAGVLLADNCSASGDRAVAAASIDGEVSGDASAMIASDLGAASSPGVIGDACAMIACDGLAGDASVAGVGCAAIASRDPSTASLFAALVATSACHVDAISSCIIGSADSQVRSANGGTAPQNVVLLASRHCDFDLGANGSAQRQYAVAGGYHASSDVAPSWRIESNGGTMRSTNAHTTSGLDYAEYFPNADAVPHEAGRLLATDGAGVRLAREGQAMAGAVSVAASVVGGDDHLGWHARYERDLHGALVFETVEEVHEVVPRHAARAYRAATRQVRARAALARHARRAARLAHAAHPTPESAEALAAAIADHVAARAELEAVPTPTPERVVNTVSTPKLRSEYDPRRPHVPRAARAAEHTRVGLLGQIRVDVDATVRPGDLVMPSAIGDGTGTRATADYLRARVDDPGVSVRCLTLTSPGIALCLVR